MSHEIERNQDYVYALVDGLPWHGVGEQRAERMTLADAVAAIPRLAETPTLCRLFYRDPSNPDERVPRDCGNRRAIVFPSDGSLIGIATDGYQPKAYADAFERVFAWVEALGAWVSGAALLRGGSRAFIMARCPSLDFTVGDDKHSTWLSVFAGSDGKTGIYPHVTGVREVCANTVAMGMADAKKAGALYSIAHHGNVDAKLAEASVALAQLSSVTDAYQRACGTMLARKLGIGEADSIVKTLIPGDSTRSENKRDAILRLATSGKGNAAYQGTAYALFQGVTDYVDHEACQSSQGDLNERRFLYGVEGAGATLKEQAFALLAMPSAVKVAA